MFKFKSFKMRKEHLEAHDLWLSLQILKLAYVWRHKIFDDFAFQKQADFCELVQGLTERFYPYFWSVWKMPVEFKTRIPPVQSKIAPLLRLRFVATAAGNGFGSAALLIANPLSPHTPYGRLGFLNASQAA